MYSKLSLQLRFMYHLSEFYCVLAGFLISQEVAYFVACTAEKHSVMGHVVIRCIFFMVQTLMLVVYDYKLHWFQIRDVCLITFNGMLFTAKVDMHPITSLSILFVLTMPWYNRIANQYSD